MKYIPIYRAKRINTNDYVIGYLVPYTFENKKWVIQSSFNYNSDYIDPTTLSIHFPDMLDSEGTKIFASLSEDGKGGDIIKGDFTCKDFTMGFLDIYSFRLNYNFLKVIGIQK